ncbi:hypothetical protein TNCV_1623351 [Trichonephila clavipes]|nr:hypothetical protein TNCV_1623351 [Trichonephila clavipes]
MCHSWDSINQTSLFATLTVEPGTSRLDHRKWIRVAWLDSSGFLPHIDGHIRGHRLTGEQFIHHALASGNGIMRFKGRCQGWFWHF